MILDRLEFLKAVGFLKPAIVTDQDTSAFHSLHLRVEQDRVVLTAGNSDIAKKVVMVRPISTDEMSKEQLEKDKPHQFMIPYSNLMSFETLIKKHKAKAKKLGKKDQGYLYIEIEKDRLESFGVELVYTQPSCEYRDFESGFDVQKGPVSEIFLVSSNAEKAFKGFDGSSPVEVSMCGDGKAIHLFQKSTKFEAIVQQCAAPEGD